MKTIAILICVGLFVSDSRAIEFSNPIRSVSASNNKGSSDSKSSSDFERFNESASVSWEEYWDGYGWGRYQTTGSQDSTITSDGIAAKGSAGVTKSMQIFCGLEALYEYSSSIFQVDFEIDGTNLIWPDSWVTLSGQTEEIFSQHLGGPIFDYDEKQINETFFLDTGIYTLSARAVTDGWYSGPGIGGGASASYDITLTPEPATLLLLGLGAVIVRKRR
jgi:hypothetical protein